MNRSNYSTEIADAIRNHFESKEIKFSFDENIGVFRFGTAIDSRLRSLQCVVSVDNNSFSVYAVAPINAASDDKAIMANMAEYICRVNYKLKAGNFELDFDDGEIRYRLHVLCDGTVPSDKTIGSNIFCAMHMFRKFGDGFISIMFNDENAENALEMCEKSETRKFLSLLEKMNSRKKSDESGSETSGSGVNSGDEDKRSFYDIMEDLFSKKGDN